MQPPISHIKRFSGSVSNCVFDLMNINCTAKIQKSMSNKTQFCTIITSKSKTKILFVRGHDKKETILQLIIFKTMHILFE